MLSGISADAGTCVDDPSGPVSLGSGGVRNPDRRMLLVHAHPDDETTGTGATMAHYAAQGAAVTLVTCTLGELGEIHVPELAGLAADRADQLGGYRIGELAAAMGKLGVTDFRFLGGAGRFRDSGMMGTPGNEDPRAFWRADSDPDVFVAAVTAAAAVIREVRPQVLITYDPNGGYGHPDHIMAHRVAMAAVDAAAGPDGQTLGWQVQKVYWLAIPRSAFTAGAQAAKDAGIDFFEGITQEMLDVMGTPDDLVSAAIDGRDLVEAKLAAFACYPTQVPPDSPLLVMAETVGPQWLGTEFFQLVRGEAAGPRDADGREIDLFAGVSS